MIVEKTEFDVRLVEITSITKHDNADTLSIVDVEGYPVIVRTTDFKVGDKAIYIPVDALVPIDRKEFAFLKKKDNKTHHRIKAMRLRGIFSMGLLITAGDLDPMLEGLSIQQQLGIEKYVPPSERRAEAHLGRIKAAKEARNSPKLPIYGLDPMRKYASVLQEGEQVCITEKIHGCSFKAIYSKGRLWVGSHRIMRGSTHHRIVEWFKRQWLKFKDFLGIKHQALSIQYAGDIWWEQADRLNLKDKLIKFPDIAIYGEVYGEHCQDLTYDSPVGRKFRAFDAYDYKNNKFLSYQEFLNFISAIGLHPVDDVVPLLYRGPWNQEVWSKWKEFADNGKTHLAPDQTAPHITEGVVIKPVVERTDPHVGRVALKYAGESYLMSRKDEE